MIVVDFWDLVLRHVLDIVVVLDESVSVDSVLVGALIALNKHLEVLLIKDDADTGQAALLLGDVPDTLEALRLRQVLEETDLAPVAKLVLVLPETVGSDTIGSHVTTATTAEPVDWQARVEAPVIEGLEGEPATWHLLRVAVLGTLGDQVVTDVDILVLTLQFLAWTLARANFTAAILLKQNAIKIKIEPKSKNLN